MRRYSWLLVFLTVILVITSLFPSCTSSPAGEVSLKGWANPYAPISGATVKVLDTSGRVIHEARNATFKSGTFYLQLNNLPADFSIVVKDGTQDNKAFQGELKAEFKNFNPVLDIAILEMQGANPNPTPTPIPAGGSAGAWIAEQLAASVVSYIVGQAFGSALDSIGFGGGDTISQDILNALAQIQTQLVNLQNDVKALANQLNAVEYNTAVRQLEPLINVIQSTYKQLNYYSNTPVTDPDKRKKDQAELMSIIRTQIMTQPNQIHDFMVGAGQTQGLIQLWSRIVAGKVRYFTKYDSDKQQKMFDYYDQLQALQLQLTIEFYHANKDSAVMMNDAIALYNRNRAEEATLVPPAVPVGAIVLTPSRFTDPKAGDAMLYLIPQKMVYNTAIDQVFRTQYLGFSGWHVPRNYVSWYKDVGTQEIFGHDEPMNDTAYSAAKGWPQELWHNDLVFWTGDITGDGQSAYDTTTSSRTVIPEDTNAYVLACRRLAQNEWYFYNPGN